MSDFEPPTYDEAYVEANYPITLARDTFYRQGTRYDIDTAETAPGKFETCIFTLWRVGDTWLDKEDDLRHVGEVFYNDRIAALNYHQEWVEYFMYHHHRPKFRQV